MRIFTGIVCVLLLVGLSGAALAKKKEKSEARTQFRMGVELYDGDKYDQAAIAFARAYELKPSYMILYNIAQTENQLGNYTAALDAYQRYLKDGGDNIGKKRLPQIEAEIERLNTLVGTITITGEEEGAFVFIDSRAEGNTPLSGPILVDIGEHEVLVKHNGIEVHRQVVKVAGGADVAVHWTPPPEVKPASDPTMTSEEEENKRVWTWVSLGVAGAAGIAGGVIGGVALSGKNDIVDNHCFDDNHCLASQADERDRVKNLSITADVLYGVAGAAFVAAVILFFVEPNMGDEEEEPIVAAPMITDDSAGIAITGRF